MFRKTNLPESLFNKVTRLYAAILTEKNGILRDILENLFTEHHHMTATALQKNILPISSKETYLLFIREQRHTQNKFKNLFTSLFFASTLKTHNFRNHEIPLRIYLL